MKIKRGNNIVGRIRERFLKMKYLSAMRKLNIGGISSGNKIKLITTGTECFKEYFKCINAAEFSINLETYIFKSDHTGWKTAEQLSAAAKRGVTVLVIYDALGSFSSDGKIFSYMKDNGITVLEYHPLSPFKKFFNLSLRDHKKVLVVDGKTAFIGGLNIGDEYSGLSQDSGQWRDTHLKIEGPAVNNVQYFFADNWVRYKGKLIDRQTLFPQVAKKGRKLLMILSSKGKKNVRPIYESYISAIKNAAESIYISNAYFIPDKKIYANLIKAAKRGVDVKILVPGIYDVPFVKYAVKYLYKKLHKNGIKIYEYRETVMHCKTAVIDGYWSTVGSSNLDRLSFYWNLEINAVILCGKFGKLMNNVFSNDLKNAKEITADDLIRRGIFEYFKEWVFYRFRKIL